MIIINSLHQLLRSNKRAALSEAELWELPVEKIAYIS